jgi:hypothetical protein
MGFRSRRLSWALRRVRRSLDQEHARIMQLDPNTLFDQQRIRAAARPGQIYLNNTAPVFLVVSSSEEDSAKTDERSIKSVGDPSPAVDENRFPSAHQRSSRTLSCSMDVYFGSPFQMATGPAA